MLAVYFPGNSVTIQVFTDQWVLALVVKCPGETFLETISRKTVTLCFALWIGRPR